MKKKFKKLIKRLLNGGQTNKDVQQKLPYEIVGQAWEDSEKPLAFMFGFNPWKREHISKFFPEYRTAYVFGSAGIERFADIFNKNRNFVFIIWGFKEPVEFLEYAKKHNVKVYRVEDGFVRSVGLGAAHTLPLSIIADSRTLYFNSREASDLEVLLETTDFSNKKELIEKADRCMNMLINMGVSKYNHTTRTNVEEIYGVKTKKRILVIGQVEDDASIRYGCAKSMTNNDLVRAAAQENPDAEIIYKPHPDVLGGFRKAYSNPMDVADIAKVVTEPLSLVDAFETIDHVYTITSLAGFEALIREIKVTCFGAPFYSGWGLTDDRQPCERRTKTRTVKELFAAAYILYPKYLNPETDQLIDLEEAILILKKMIVQNTFNSGVEKRKQKQLDIAETLIRQAIAQTKDFHLILNWNLELIEVLKEKHVNDQALAIVNELIDTYQSKDHKAVLYNHRALIQRAVGQYKSALEDIKVALGYSRDLNTLNTFIELSWELEGLTENLIKHVNEIIATYEDIPSNQIQTYASFYIESGNRDLALNLLEKHEISTAKLPYLGLAVLDTDTKDHTSLLNNKGHFYHQLIKAEGTFAKLVNQENIRYCAVGSEVDNTLNGADIDNYDVVIRIGDYMTDFPHQKSIGSKTNIWFTPVNAHAAVKNTKVSELDLIVVNDNNPIYRSKLLSGFVAHFLEREKQVEVYPSVYYRELVQLLGHAPSDEIMALYWLYKIKGPLSKETIIGFSYDQSTDSTSLQWLKEKEIYQSLFDDKLLKLNEKVVLS